jgi:hypothetical protein
MQLAPGVGVWIVDVNPGEEGVEMSIKRVFGFIILTILLVATMGVGAYAQMAGTGVVVGTVTDPAKAAVAGATVTLTDVTTKAVRTATTNDTGRYSFPNVPPGKYTVVIVKAGFRQVKFTDQEVLVGESRTLDAALEIGTSTEVVEVTTTNTELQTMNATIGNTVTGLALDSLPTIQRDASTFVTLQPGVTPDGSVAGAIYDQNTYQLDGGNNSNDMDGTMNIYTPSAAGDTTGGLVSGQVTGNFGGGPTGVIPAPVDSIEEFKVGTSNQTADFNSSAGAQVQMVTKRGTDQWHGSVYEYYFDNNWNGNTWDNNANGVTRPSYHYNRFGASGSGAIIPKAVLGGKWYFFGLYEGFRWPLSETANHLVPSDLMKQGILQFKDAAGNVECANMTATTVAVPCGTAGNANVTGYPNPAMCPGDATKGIPPGPCDPRGLWASPTMLTLMNMMPEPTPGVGCSALGTSKCDGLNTQAFSGLLRIPWNENFGVARLDHDFGSKWHFNATYHYFNMQRETHNQVDIGGAFPGDTKGVPASVHNRPQQPWYLTAGLTTNITTNVTNSFNFSYLRNYWARYFTAPGLSQQPQVKDLGGALQPYGESRTANLTPYNLDTQNVRTRFWDGQDLLFRDDVSWIKGTHFFQFGGSYQHNYNWHQRTDNGGFINNEIVYDLAAGGLNSPSGTDMTGYVPTGLKGTSNWAKQYAILMGIPSVSQVAYIRTAPDLAIQPVGTPVFDQSSIPYYNLYFSDSWRVKPTLTITYGLGWSLEMPPYEKNGKQIVAVDQNGKPLSTEDFLSKREQAALAGQVYNPYVGFSLVHNVTGHPKYPYQPFYGGFSPRVAAAWNPSFDSGLLGDVFGRNKTVVRGGYGILYGRLNGVALLLTPLLSTGMIQPVQCYSPLNAAGAAANGGDPCGGTSTPNTAWRIGLSGGGAGANFDGLTAPIVPALPTLPQPDYPGVNAVSAGASEALDYHFRPSMSQEYNLTVQRQINAKTTIEFGYLGRKYTHDLQSININAVPYMMNVGGQSFAKAYGQLAWQYCGGASGLAGGNCGGPSASNQFINNPNLVTPQAFFETALGGKTSAYCSGYSSCTAAVAANEGFNGTGNLNSNFVYSLYSDLDNGAFTFARSMMNTPIPGNEFGANGQIGGIAMDVSNGYGNYNAAFVSWKMTDWKGLTLQSNFTYGKALGTGSIVQATSEWTVPDAYNLRSAYGLQSFDRKYLWNLFFIYQPPLYKTQHGFVGRLLGGWSVAPILSLGSGLPQEVIPTDYTFQYGNQTGGAQMWGQSNGTDFSSYENAINMCGPGAGGSSRHNNPNNPGGVFGGNGYGPGLYQDPGAVYNCFRNPILGIDGSGGGGAGILRGQMFWNVDIGIRKDIAITERFHLRFDANFTNIFNHPQLYDPYNALGDPDDWGALEGQVNVPRQMQFGLRFQF